MASPGDNRTTGRWTFLTNHARVLLEIARDPDVRLRDVAHVAGITERAAQAIVADLEAAGYVTRTRVGRRNRYTVDPKRRFRHPAESDLRIDGLLALFTHRETSPSVEDDAAESEGSSAEGSLSAVASSSAATGVTSRVTAPVDEPSGPPADRRRPQCDGAV
ncbi:winged helix-turn-helix domain-containing protein [Thermopolyspora sp. NPDC052614]|uniref:helix-turn-helix transcriptional regulator n=1 Tax=Thermopolyspora sp. NPDC052614 TaxID=3155682 RepID=UPI00343C2778